MAEGQRDEISDSVETVRKRALNPFVDDSVISERIATLMRSKAEHLSEITKIYRKLDGYLEDYKLSVEVEIEAHRLDTQWKRYSHVYYELIKLLADESAEKMHEEDRYARNSEIYYDYAKSIDQYMAGLKERITSATDGKGPEADNSMDLTEIFSPNLPLFERGEDNQSTCSGRSRGSSASRSSLVREDAKLQKILSEKKLEQLKRAKARKLKEEQLKLDNQIAEAEDAAELANTKVQFFEELEDAVSVVSRASSVHDIRSKEQPKNVKPKLTFKESKDQSKGLDVIEHETELKDERPLSRVPLAENSVPTYIPLFSSTPGGAAVLEVNVKESNLDPVATPFVQTTLPPSGDSQPGYVSPFNSTTETMVTKLTASIDSIVTKSNLPPLDVVKFSGNPCEYFRFKARFDEMVGTQNISETQKMSRLLQFLDGQARSAVAGFEGVPGGLSKALKMLQQRFGQPHIVTKACVDALIDGPNISSNDGPGLRKFADHSRTLYETLTSMNSLSEMNMTNLAKMAGKLPITFQLKWRDEALRIREKGRFPSLKDLVEFIERRADAANDPVFGRVGETRKFVPRKDTRGGRKQLPPISDEPKVMTMATQLGTNRSETPSTCISNKDSNPAAQKGVQGGRCYSCESTHKIEHCPDFTNKSVRQRVVFARYKGLCLNCLRKGHFASQCQSTFRCKHCQQPHHSLLHKAAEDKEGSAANTPENTDLKERANVNATTAGPIEVSSHIYSMTSRTKVALQVVPVEVMNKEGHSVTTYALLDTGSEETFLSKAISDKLGLEVSNCDTLAVCTLSGESLVKVGQANVRVKAVGSCQDRTVTIKNAKVVDNLNITTTRAKDLSRWPHLKDLKIPDVDDKQVTMLIGANVPEVQIHEECRKGKSGEPYAVRTVLGWAVLGPVDTTSASCPQPVNVNFVKYGDEMLDHQMKQFLRLEDNDMNRSSKKGMSIEDQEALKRMESSVRVVEGHYEIGMLWKGDYPWMPDNKQMAEARLQSLKRKLKRDDEFHRKYRAFMNNLISRGYARKLTEGEAARRSSRTWYLPHHGVFHPQKQYKIRVVFDAASMHNGVSLNNQLHQGPDLTNSLLGVLLRFRQYPIALVADIEGMFNQVKVPPEDADALRFLWWEDSDLERPSEFQMTSHIFGATDSPSCANFCLKRAAEDGRGRFSDDAVNAVNKDFYVDDFVKSVRTVNEASSLAVEVTCLLSEVGFRLTKWMSNNRQVLSKIPEEERAKPTLDLDLEKLPVERTLGVQWDVEKDVLLFKVREPHQQPTKRGILSAVSSLYDPMGFVCPVVLEAKKILQRLWKLNLGWDDEIPEELQSRWNRWKCELSALSQIQVPRCHLVDSAACDVSLHLFSDASEDGYGMCAYLRFVYASGTIRCSFLVGRSKSSKVRPISIPRHELQAATLSVKMYRVLVDELTYEISEATFWSDSQTTLQYIKNETKRFQTYVANRVTEISEFTSPDQWRHCPGKSNPADDASRGLNPQKLSSQQRWWKGPNFLWEAEECWPSARYEEVPDSDPEVRTSANAYPTTVESHSVESHVSDCSKTDKAQEVDHGGLKKLIETCSSWRILQRRVAWLVRFCHWIQNERVACSIGPLTLEELSQSTQVIVRSIQSECFPEDIKQVKKSNEVKKSSNLRNLRPVLVDGVQRVGGRLQRAVVLSWDEKHPMILPKRHPVSQLVVRHYHESAAHSGREQTLCEVRRMFWIIDGRCLVKNTIRNCIKCRRMNAKPMEQFMGSLPKARLEAYQPPFTFTAVDLFGPLTVKWGRGTAKRWGCLFTCLTTRAVYLEVTPSLEADDFIMVLRQFISRRGPHKEIWSDRGTNFVGANRELKEAIAGWNEEKIERHLQQKGIKWVFQPPAAPHMSGVWERLVQITKKHLKSAVGDALLTDVELRTLLAEVESIVNNRPITAVSDDPDDCSALTPNHFLLQRATQLPPGVFVNEDQFSRKRWRKVQFLADHYWKRWIREYVPALQSRPKWFKSKRNVRIGDLVLLAEDKLVRNRWPMGRVVEVFTGEDGGVRSAEVKTAGGVFHRPVVKICLLEEVADDK